MSNPVVSSTNHPSDETLAALVDGRLDEQTRKTIIEHIATCDDCHAVWMAVAEANETLDLDETSKPANVTEGHFGRGRWYSLIAIAAAIAIGFALWPYAQTYRNRDAVIEASASREDRPSLARLSGDHPYRVAEPVTRGDEDNGDDPDLLGVYDASLRVQKALRRRRSVENLRQYAVVQLLANNTRSAVALVAEALALDTGTEDIKTAVQKTTNARLLNDAAAIYYARASRSQTPHTHIVLAHDAAKRAWELSQSPEALWNYALTLEDLGMKAAARDAWLRYLGRDPQGPWAEEVKGRIATLDSHANAVWSEDTRNSLRDALFASQETNVRAIVAAHPGESRVFGEEELLPEWGQRPTATAFAAVRLLADAIAQTSGDRLMTDAAAVIAAAPMELRQRLASAHAAYGAAREVGRGEPSRALEIYAGAFPAFEMAKSPFADLVRVRRAGCMQRQMKYEDALRALEAVGSPESVARHGYVAMAAHVEWTRAMIEVELGLPEMAFRSFGSALKRLRMLRESSQAALHGRAAQAADMMGDGARAIEHRVLAMRLHWTALPHEQPMILMEAALGFSAAGYVQMATTVFDSLVERGRATQDRYITCTALLWRSLHHARYGRSDLAERDSGSAEPYCSALPDPAVRARVRDIGAVVSGLIAAETQLALAGLDEAIYTAEQTGSRFRRAALYAQRARRYLEARNIAAARHDAGRAMDDFAEQLRNVTQPDLHASWIEAARELVDAQVSSELAAGDVAAAFMATERQRSAVAMRSSPSLSRQASVDAVRRALAPDAALLSVHAGTRTAIFIIRQSGVWFEAVNVSRTGLEQQIQSFRVAIQNDESEVIEAHARALYASIIAPVRAHLRGVKKLIVIADGPLARLPIAALRDVDGRYLMQSLTISTIPTAGALLLPHSCTARVPLRRAVVIAGARQLRDGELALADPAAEIEDIASLYSNVQVLRDATATPEAILATAQIAEVLHYTGHAVANERQPKLSALVLPHDRTGTAFLYAHQIAERDWSGTRLVVLAGCSTNRRDSALRPLGSLAHTFMGAGAQSVIGTLWDVEDEASRAASRKLHAIVAGGATPAEALQRMQQELSSSSVPLWRSPKTWAAWTVIGGCDAHAPGR